MTSPSSIDAVGISEKSMTPKHNAPVGSPPEASMDTFPASAYSSAQVMNIYGNTDVTRA